jgi:hypothetical protein
MGAVHFKRAVALRQGDFWCASRIVRENRHIMDDINFNISPSIWRSLACKFGSPMAKRLAGNFSAPYEELINGASLRWSTSGDGVTFGFGIASLKTG